jgi:signal peptidase I
MGLDLKKLFKSKSFRENIAIVPFAVLLFFGFRAVIQPYYISGPSMENTFQNNERLLLDKLVYKFHAPQRGDIIAFHPPVASTEPYIKRIIGLPGEQVVIQNGTVTIYVADSSHFTLDEPYIKQPPDYNYTSIVIPANEYFVLGDNRNNSTDSSHGWLVSRNEIIGKAWLNIWPVSLWGWAGNFRQPASVVATTVN